MFPIAREEILKLDHCFEEAQCVGRSSVTCCVCDCIGGRSIKKAVAEQQARAVRGENLKMVEEK